MVTRTFDLIVVGSGSAASAATRRCRAAGWSVAVAEERSLGGTCALRGCDPKKVLVGSAEALDWVRRLEKAGTIAGDVRVDWKRLQSFKRSFTDPVPEAREASLREAGVEVLRGHAAFASPTSLRVGGEEVGARHVLLATGARPADLGIPGMEHVVTSDDFLDLETLPRRIVFIGGGYISFEFAHVAARAGSKVTILQRGPRPLALFDPDLVDMLVQATRELGIEVKLGEPVQAVRREGDELVAETGTQGYPADMIVHGGGRVPNLDGLELEAGGVQREERGVTVDEHLQSVSNPAVYAGGDAAASPGLPLTPVAGAEGRAIAANLLLGNTATVDYTAVPTVVFTVPPLAAVGLGEEEARQRGLDVEVSSGDTAGWFTSRRIGERHAGYKVIHDRTSGLVLGAHFLGHHADELVNLLALAIRHGIRAQALKETLFAYPTRASDLDYML